MKISNTLLWISRIVIGITFIFSGFVKAVDPMGFMIKINEYLIAFNAQGLSSLSLIMAVILCSYELPLGVAILLGSRGRLMSWLLLVIMVPFTILTFYLAIANPVSDCGCFGDAIKITNWQTFYKNIILMVFTIVIFVKKDQIKPVFKKFSEWGVIILSSAFVVGLCIYCLSYLPIIDFRPYKPGNDIKEMMSIPEGEQGDVYETRLIYKNVKSGELKEFDMENIPMTEEWEWQETNNKLIIKGVTPPIKDFKITDLKGEDLTEKFLSEEGYRLIVVYHDLEKVNENAQNKLNELAENLNKEGSVKVWALSSGLENQINDFIKKYKVQYPIYNSDIVQLETMIRSNGGLILLKDNKIIRNWSYRKIPTAEKLNSILYD